MKIKFSLKYKARKVQNLLLIIYARYSKEITMKWKILRLLLYEVVRSIVVLQQTKRTEDFSEILTVY